MPLPVLQNHSSEKKFEGLIFAKSEELVQRLMRPVVEWSRANSLWALTFGLSCCAIEMMAFGAAQTDAERKGIFFRASPRHADVMIVAGWVAEKMKPAIKQLYDQMPEPKYVIAMGECATCGGPWWDSYSIVQGADQFIPVDIYVPGCPPRPEALLDAFMKLQRLMKERGSEYRLKQKLAEGIP